VLAVWEFLAPPFSAVLPAFVLSPLLFVKAFPVEQLPSPVNFTLRSKAC
jgi:hypothetical protein